jgi:nicotinate-nucleotide adenylyltransferase
LGLFGGTFDPPHVGHVLAASDAVEALRLDRLVFIPAARQPFKQGGVIASPQQRLEMLRLTIGDDLRFAVDAIEIDRAGLSYTVDTLVAYAAREPQARRFLLVGEDLVGQIPSWRDSYRVAELAEIVVLARGDGDPPPSRGEGEGSVHVLPFTRIATRRVDVSSTEIRDRVRAGRPVRGFVTESVAEFIHAATLYR